MVDFTRQMGPDLGYGDTGEELIVQRMLRDTVFGYDRKQELLKGLGVEWSLETGPDRYHYIRLNIGSKANRENRLVQECDGLGLRVENYGVYRLGFNGLMPYTRVEDLYESGIKTRCERLLPCKLFVLGYIRNNGWSVGIRESLFPDRIEIESSTWAEVFWDSFDSSVSKHGSSNIVPKDASSKMIYLNPNYWYVFGYVAKELYLLGMRKVIEMIDYSGYNVLDEEVNSIGLDAWANRLEVKRPEYMEFDNLRGCNEYMGSQEEGVGWVLTQWSEILRRVKRVKVDNPYWLLLEGVRGKDLGSMVRLVCEEKLELLKDSRDVDIYDQVSRLMNLWVMGSEICYRDNRENKNGNFAQDVMRTPYGVCCLDMKREEVGSSWEWLVRDLSEGGIRRLVQMFELEDKITGWRLKG